MIEGLGSRSQVKGPGSRAQGSDSRVEDLESIRGWGLGSRVSGLGFRFESVRSRVSGLGSRV
eukprot:2379522-Rhodomonas_salina.5